MKKFTLFFLGILLVIACSSDNETQPVVPANPDTTTDPTTDPEPDPTTDGPIIADNVVVISDESSNLISSEADLESGIYIIEYTTTPSAVVVNDIIVGDEEEGFLRKVNSVTVSGNTQTMETEQATLEDVFEEATIAFNLDLSDLEEVSNKGFPVTSSGIIVDYMAKGVSMANGPGVDFDMSSTVISSGAVSFKVSGNASFSPDFNFDAEISTFSIKKVNFETSAALSLSAGYQLTANGSASSTQEVKLVRFRKLFTFVVGTVPVVVTADVRLNASFNATLDGAFEASGSYNKTYTVDTGINFDNGQWSGSFNLGKSTSIDPLSYNGAINLTETLAITPNVQLKFYGVVAPYVEPQMFAQYDMNLTLPSADWDSSFGVGLNLKTGVKGVIFGRNFFDFERTDPFSVNLWSAPSSIAVVSGNEQEADEEQALADPLKIMVSDNLGNPVPFAQVYLELVKEDGEPSDSGSISEEKITTNSEGIAEFNWTLGKLSDEESIERFVEVSIKKSDGEEIVQDPPLRLMAKILNKECNAFVDLAMFTTTTCGQEININEVLVSGITTTDEDCGTGSCSFEYLPDFGAGGIGVFPARISFDMVNYLEQNKKEIILKYEDFCGEACTKAFIYDESKTLLASQSNPGSNGGNSVPREFIFNDALVLKDARFIEFSSCEAVLNCFDVTFEE